MAFVYDDDDKVVSFAEYADVYTADQRLFDTNEGLSDSTVTPYLIRATERILTKIKASSWWKSATPIGYSPDPNLIISRENDFTDLCIAVAMSEYILPIIADFGDTDNAEMNKISFYEQRTVSKLDELVGLCDWYDFNADGIISISELKKSGKINRRIR